MFKSLLMFAFLFLKFSVVVDAEDDAKAMALNVEYMIVMYRLNVLISFK